MVVDGDPQTVRFLVSVEIGGLGEHWWGRLYPYPWQRILHVNTAQRGNEPLKPIEVAWVLEIISVRSVSTASFRVSALSSGMGATLLSWEPAALPLKRVR